MALKSLLLQMINVACWWFQNNNNKFFIDSNSGVVTIGERLDYETQSFYPLVIQAQVTLTISLVPSFLNK